MKTAIAAVLLTLPMFACSHNHHQVADLPLRGGEVALRGKPLTLIGQPVEVGDRAPGFEAVGLDMKPKRLSDFSGKYVVLSVVPSVDTKVCSIQTRKFNQAVGELKADAVVLTVSKDLPMAQKRYCAAEGVDKVVMLSDYRGGFGTAWGLEIKESGLLARAVYVINPAGKVVYKQIVPELTTEPDYQAALKVLPK